MSSTVFPDPRQWGWVGAAAVLFHVATLGLLLAAWRDDRSAVL